MVSHRGKSEQPARDCDYDGKPLPLLRHPNARYCNPSCRQRDRYAKRYEQAGVKCLVCGKRFARVGSHVVQIHGYADTAEYLEEFGLMAKETRTIEHAELMRDKNTEKSRDNLRLGKPNRFKDGGDHGERVKEFWKNRKKRRGYENLGCSLGNH